MKMNEHADATCENETADFGISHTQTHIFLSDPIVLGVRIGTRRMRDHTSSLTSIY